MIVTKKTDDLKSSVEHLKNRNFRIGFVPTMGALHEGHISLIKCGKKECDIIVVSIFVNPSQFNDRNDYERYPRTIEDDLNKLSNHLSDNDIVFTPSEEEVYHKPVETDFDFGYLETVMEGKHRKGHFKGVAQVVHRLFEIVRPHDAFFGEKDYQQLMIIKALVKQKNMPVNIIGCPLIRDHDGLALSSRNALLTPVQRKNAIRIPQTLFEAREIAFDHPVGHVKQYVINTIQSNDYLSLDYFEIADELTLQPVGQWKQHAKLRVRGFVAVKVDEVRLIDNLKFY